jgi:hypothetical protein
MCQFKYNGKHSRIDKCMTNLITALKSSDHKPLACCCGHGRYHTTIIVNSYGNIYELMSGKHILRKRNFYKTDSDGFYFIPEVEMKYGKEVVK